MKQQPKIKSLSERFSKMGKPQAQGVAKPKAGASSTLRVQPRQQVAKSNNVAERRGKRGARVAVGGASAASSASARAMEKKLALLERELHVIKSQKEPPQQRAQNGRKATTTTTTKQTQKKKKEDMKKKKKKQQPSGGKSAAAAAAGAANAAARPEQGEAQSDGADGNGAGRQGARSADGASVAKSNAELDMEIDAYMGNSAEPCSSA